MKNSVDGGIQYDGMRYSLHPMQSALLIIFVQNLLYVLNTISNLSDFATVLMEGPGEFVCQRNSTTLSTNDGADETSTPINRQAPSHQSA